MEIKTNECKTEQSDYWLEIIAKPVSVSSKLKSPAETNAIIAAARASLCSTSLLLVQSPFLKTLEARRTFRKLNEISCSHLKIRNYIYTGFRHSSYDNKRKSPYWGKVWRKWTNPVPCLVEYCNGAPEVLKPTSSRFKAKPLGGSVLTVFCMTFFK